MVAPSPPGRKQAVGGEEASKEGIARCLRGEAGRTVPRHPPRPFHVSGHCQPPQQGTWHLLAAVGGIFHSAAQPGAVPGAVGSRQPGGTCPGKGAYPIRPHFPRLGQGGEADRTCQRGEGEALCSPAQPCPTPSWPTQVGVEAAPWSLGPPRLKTKMVQRPPFSAPSEG